MKLNKIQFEDLETVQAPLPGWLSDALSYGGAFLALGTLIGVGFKIMT